MNLILTHDNADFDAVASQLAAYKLVPDSTPVLPSRLNRNVRHYLTLYWDELPYTRARDLPKEPIERVLVVDTQTMQSLRGMSDQTAVRVVDHHARRDDLNPAWHLTLDTVGATTTLFVEQLRDGSAALTAVEATTLLLGIYEDTGALTYGSTTPRDAFAAAWLLERGALLDVCREFLHHALADDQLALLEKLEENAHTYDIEGYPVVIAAASAPDLVEEVATLAHKLRDLLDPAALFLLVDLGSHIQMVARATADALDVGRVAEHFGGGGHGRASAAIIRDMSLREAENALLAILPRIVQPALTVADLMSRGVHTLPPTTRARDAVRQMRRYGYEGFPVVHEGRVIGLLTRRAVDRALDHGLEGVRVDQLMEAGEVTVRPSNSMAALQQVMMTSGWGQVPVVDDAGQIAGIVTRTDLIKHLNPPETPATLRREAVVARLEAALPPVLLALIREAGRTAQSLNANLYLVGGSVRDLLLGQPTLDLDFVVEGDAIALTRALAARFGGDTRSHARFGTGKWLLDLADWQRIAVQLNTPLPDTMEKSPAISPKPKRLRTL